MASGGSKPSWTGVHTLGLLVILIAFVVIAFIFPGTEAASGLRIFFWILVLALIFVFSLIVGHGITGLWRGVLIDDRNKISLSRFQAYIWTLLIVSAFVASAFWRLNEPSLNVAQVLTIGVDPVLWGLIGITSAALVGSPLIRSNQKRLNLLALNSTPSDASWSDMFRGEKTTNADHVDLGKVQAFFFTVLLAVVYVGLIIESLQRGEAPTALPTFSEGMLALLGISNAAYLTNKAVPN